MRITTGKFRGRNIDMPKGIRPTQDKVRKALFDILGDVQGLLFLELFAGSGAVGLEAASRGAATVVFIEDNRACIKMLEANINALQAKNCIVYPMDVQKAIIRLHADQRKFDIIFLDPPYYQDTPKKTLQTLGGCDILAPNGFIVIQHFKRDTLPESTNNLSIVKQARYGDTVLTFYRKEVSSVPESDLSRDL